MDISHYKLVWGKRATILAELASSPLVGDGGEKVAVPTGFEPAFSALTGPRVWPGYTTGPAQRVYQSRSWIPPLARSPRNRARRLPFHDLDPWYVDFEELNLQA